MRRNLPLLSLVAAVGAVYLGSFRGVFQFDDYNVIVGNPVAHGLGAFLADLPRGIRPLLKLTYTLNWIFGPGPFGFHLVNTALHAANAVLLFRIARRVGGPSLSAFAAFVPALWFAVHPVQTEAVTYISGRSVSLMAFFYLSSLLAWLKGREEGRPLLLYAASPSLFLLAVLSKETAVTLPFALALAEGARGGGKGWKDAFAAQAVHWAMLACLAFLLLAHPGYGRLLESCFGIRSASENLLTQVGGIAYLLSRLILLNAQNIDPDLPVVREGTASLLPPALLLLLLLAAGAYAFRKRSLAGFGILWFFLHLLPTNSIVPRLDVANERQLYLASWGLFLALASFADRIPEGAWRRRAAVCALLLAAMFGGFTVLRNAAYRSEVALWEDTARKSPGKARAHNNLGYAYRRAGRFAEAREEYLRALAIDPGHPFARGNLGELERMGIGPSPSSGRRSSPVRPPPVAHQATERGVVPEEGVEPSRPCGHGILSPARLPVPPLRLVPGRPPRSPFIHRLPR